MIAKVMISSVSMMLLAYFSIATESTSTAMPGSILSAIDSSKDIQQFYIKHIETREKAAALLCKEIPSANDIMKKCRMLFLLGLFPSNKSIPTLIRNLDVKNPEYDKQNKELPFLPQYPAHDALIRIGISSLPAIKQTFLGDQSKIRRDLCLSIIYQIYAKGMENENALSFLMSTLKDDLVAMNDENRITILQHEIDVFIKRYTQK